MTDWSNLVDLEQRTVSPRVFTDPEVYQAEQERVFGRCWLYVTYATQIYHPGDFVTSYMGEEPVIVCRHGEGRVHVFVNSCQHRGSRVCRLDAGNTRTFTCPYHGWTYDMQGRLVGVPQFQEAYYGELKRDEWGLLEVPRVDLYRECSRSRRGEDAGIARRTRSVWSGVSGGGRCGLLGTDSSGAGGLANRYWPSGFVAGQSSSRLYHWPGPPRGWRIDVCHVRRTS